MPNIQRFIMNQQSVRQDLLISYLELRKAIGIIGMALPFVLSIGKCLLQGPGIQDSISCYYYTEMRNILVGSLCAIGVFLLSYRGYEGDEKFGRLACVSAIGVALFPTAPCICTTSGHTFIGRLHQSFAALLFLTLAYFSLCLFTKTVPGRENERTPQKLQRNKVYYCCGSIIIGCIILITVVELTSLKTHIEWLAPVFWLESLAIFVFGVSWFVKGEAILKDLPIIPNPPSLTGTNV
jgi:hypothetical protein